MTRWVDGWIHTQKNSEKISAESKLQGHVWLLENSVDFAVSLTIDKVKEYIIKVVESLMSVLLFIYLR